MARLDAERRLREADMLLFIYIYIYLHVVIIYCSYVYLGGR